MSRFDIIWLIVCIGLPILSGVLSAGKKQKAKTKAGEPAGKKDFLEDILKEVVREFKENSSSADIDIDDEDENSGKTPASPEADGGLSPATYGKNTPSVSPAMAGGMTANVRRTTKSAKTMTSAGHAGSMAANPVRPVSTYHQHSAPEHLRGESGNTTAKPAPQIAGSKAGVERIDPRRMIIYDAVLNPKFRE